MTEMYLAKRADGYEMCSMCVCARQCVRIEKALSEMSQSSINSVYTPQRGTYFNFILKCRSMISNEQI
jgi:hypothetical protein